MHWELFFLLKRNDFYYNNLFTMIFITKIKWIMKIGIHSYGSNDKKVIVNNFYIVEMYFIL